jgi:CSLREA domain-containing protein
LISTADTAADDDDCTLREAITNANNNDQTASTDCAPGSVAISYTIVFDPSVSGTIALDENLGPLTVTDPAGLTIDGAQEDITVSGKNEIQVIIESEDAKLAVENLTIADGFADIPCPNGGFGGAIANINGGKLKVVNSTFSDNKAGTVGGILNNSELEVTYSTFSANGTFLGGGIDNANVAGATTTLSNTIFANNEGGNIRNVCADNTCQGTINDDGYNISSDSSFTFTDPTSKNSTNPLLAPNGLQNNGGPTQTIALQPTSPAVNAIPPSINGCTTTITTD